MCAFECCNKVEQQRAVKLKFKSGLVNGSKINIGCSDQFKSNSVNPSHNVLSILIFFLISQGAQ